MVSNGYTLGNRSAADVLVMLLVLLPVLYWKCQGLFCAIEHNVQEFNLTADRTTKLEQTCIWFFRELNFLEIAIGYG